MFKYYTKVFTDPTKIDPWLHSFQRDVPASLGNEAEIVGYVSLNDKIVVTIKRFEPSKRDLKAYNIEDNG